MNQPPPPASAARTGITPQKTLVMGLRSAAKQGLPSEIELPHASAPSDEVLQVPLDAAVRHVVRVAAGNVVIGPGVVPSQGLGRGRRREGEGQSDAAHRACERARAGASCADCSLRCGLGSPVAVGSVQSNDCGGVFRFEVRFHLCISFIVVALVLMATNIGRLFVANWI